MRELQARIIDELNVAARIDPAAEVEKRTDFLVRYLKATGASGFVLGISGGQDSSLAGRLCQLAVERLAEQSVEAEFMAVRLPYSVQHDEDDAQLALAMSGYVVGHEQALPDLDAAADLWEARDLIADYLGEADEGGREGLLARLDDVSWPGGESAAPGYRKLELASLMVESMPPALPHGEAGKDGRIRTVALEPAAGNGPAGTGVRVTVDGQVQEVNVTPTDLGYSVVFAGGRTLDAAVTERTAGEWWCWFPSSTTISDRMPRPSASRVCRTLC